MADPGTALGNLLSAPVGHYDDDAVRELLESHPEAARNCGLPDVVYRAIVRRASATTVRLLGEACPNSVQSKHYHGAASLYAACRYEADLDVVRALYDLWPEALGEKDRDGCTPLHVACRRDDGPALELIQFLASQRPKTILEKDRWGRTPLATACEERAYSDEDITFLVEKCPSAVKETVSEGWTPLHSACYNYASLKAVTLLADRYPKALEMKTDIGQTPLHLACASGATLEVVKLLVERYPEALELQNTSGLCPLQCAGAFTKSRPENIELLTKLQPLNRLTDNDPQIMDMIRSFQEMRWPGGVALVLNAFPSVGNKMDQKLMPAVLSLVGRRCNLNAFYMMLQDNPTLVKGAVKKGKRSEKPPAKKSRTE